MSEYLMDKTLYAFLEAAADDVFPLEFYMEGSERPIVLNVSETDRNSPFVKVYKETIDYEDGVIDLNKLSMVFKARQG